MSLSIWDYIRRRASEATLAGFQDALDYLERQDQAQMIHAAAKSFRKRMHELPNNGGNGNGNHSEHPSGTAAPTGGPPHIKPQQPALPHSPQQQLPGMVGMPAAVPNSSPAPAQQTEHRKPGRPRKEVNG